MMRLTVVEREELLDKIEAIEYWQEHFANRTFLKALRAVVELPKEFTDQMNINIVNKQDPVLIAKMFYKAGYKDAMYKVIDVIESKLNG